MAKYRLQFIGSRIVKAVGAASKIHFFFVIAGNAMKALLGWRLLADKLQQAIQYHPPLAIIKPKYDL